MHLLLSTAFVLLSALEASPAALAELEPGQTVVLIVPTDTIPPVQAKSPQRAFLLSAANFLVPTAFGIVAGTTQSEVLNSLGILATVYGIYIGPCVGHLYAENIRCWRGTLFRLGMTGVVGVGLTIAVVGVIDDIWGDGDSDVNSAVLAGSIIALAGTVGLYGSAARDVIKAPEAARRWNAEQGITSTQVIPLLDPIRKGAGLALRVRF